MVDLEKILGNEHARQQLWGRISSLDTVGMTKITFDTLMSMLHHGDDAVEMAKRYNISRALAHTRRNANGRRVLEALAENPETESLFVGLTFEGEVVHEQG